jgi:light-regulated signal transduction histidine kinase (bacteriophytochrome)
MTEPDLVVVQASANTGRILGIERDPIVGVALSKLLESPVPDDFIRLAVRPVFHPQDALAFTIGERTFDGIVHRSGGLLILELEPAQLADESGRSSHELYSLIRNSMARVEQAQRLADMWPILAATIRDISGFDRVMIYCFNERDGSGEVIAEQVSPGLEPYLGLHYPASDVPNQARRLYVQNRLRLICDAAYEPTPIIPAENPLTGARLDLSGAVLRSVSPIHCRYLANMGVRASMSVSIIKDERLWGLIACHHGAPRFVPYRNRMVCGLLGDFVSWSLRPRLEFEASDARLRASTCLSQLVEAMSLQSDVLTRLVDNVPHVLDLVGARGFATSHRGDVETCGVTPSHEQIAELVNWLEKHLSGDVLATDSLAALYPPAAAFKDVASGLLVAGVSNAHKAYLLWFQPEVVQEVCWAGDPRKPVEVEAEQLTPRKSFASWKETVRERSLPWPAWAVRAATDLRVVTGKLILQRLAESLNLELRHAVQSRDDFLSMASHELKTPTTTLRLHLEMLRRMASRSDVSPGQIMTRIDKAERQVDRLDLLISHLLDVSRISAGRLDLERTHFDLVEVVSEVFERFGDSSALFRLDAAGNLRGNWDRFRLDQVLTNLLSNALKYGQGKPVDVVLRGEEDCVRCTVGDHGIGISPAAQLRIFDRFERAAPPKFAGLGLGLWIVRQIVERHGGTIEVQSEPGSGASFTFTLPRGEELR